MPRQARLDAPGTLHHVILRGIARGRSSRMPKTARRSSRAWGTSPRQPGRPSTPGPSSPTTPTCSCGAARRGSPSSCAGS
jgi:hypothetical protein